MKIELLLFLFNRRWHDRKDIFSEPVHYVILALAHKTTVMNAALAGSNHE